MVENPANADPPLPADKPHRRHWFRFGLFLLFVVVTVAAAAAIRVFSAATYTASALIQVATEQPKIINSVDTHSNFDLYKNTQIQLLTSDFVLTAALRNVGQLEIVTRQDDPVRWLAKTLQVESPGNAEILQVSLATPQKNDAVTIVHAVVAAYMTEVADKERSERHRKLMELDIVFNEKESILRTKLTQLKQLAEALGDGGQTGDRMQPQITDLRRSLADLRLAEMQAELRIAHLKHDVDGLDRQSAKFKAAKAEAEAAEIDREFWSSKSAPLIAEIDELQKRLDRKAHESIDAEMLRGEIESLKKLVRALDDERQRVQIELKSKLRVTVVQPAQ